MTYTIPFSQLNKTNIPVAGGKGASLWTARTTDPGWTPLFMNASGVVLEIGGALQHGAVIAREYGLPCVSGVESTVMNIPDGAMIEVDGSNGIVRLIESA